MPLVAEDSFYHVIRRLHHPYAFCIPAYHRTNKTLAYLRWLFFLGNSQSNVDVEMGRITGHRLPEIHRRIASSGSHIASCEQIHSNQGSACPSMHLSCISFCKQLFLSGESRAKCFLLRCVMESDYRVLRRSNCHHYQEESGMGDDCCLMRINLVGI